ncbi:hypothetical protein [Azospirillum argentinense]|uniref:Hypervirulence associated protein TUDOR domain-containing protein n=1 Tax=Azospirillum brasilense TaxID=192 RepID=A0A4D8QBZ6_AZOBR|nr:hypothetical protein [Azospirillum argentinense]QCO07284.1 hypothetical protein D3867_35980 [Azospirillum argentinense]
MADFKKGDRVSFKPGPKAKDNVTATVSAIEGAFLVTKDDDGKERRVRPGACTAAPAKKAT